MHSGLLSRFALELEPCADFMAPVSFDRRPVQKYRRRRGRPKNLFKDSRKNFVLSSKFSDDLFSHRKLQQNNYAAIMASAARRQIIGGGGGRSPVHKSRRWWCPQIVGGARLYLGLMFHISPRLVS